MTIRPDSILRQAIETARALENAASQKRLRGPFLLTGFGVLVRHRQLAVAVQRLGRESAYESRLLLRTMLEIHINHAWIRLRNSHSRALRFQQFWSLERLRILERSASVFRPNDYQEKRRLLEIERRKVRHLFRRRDKEGKLRWARDWASVSSVEARLTEIQKQGRPDGPVDAFLYGLYSRFSSAVHGSSNSLSEVLTVADGRVSSALHPEPHPNSHKKGAFIVLAASIEAFAKDAQLRRQCRGDIQKVSAIVEELRRRSRHL
jgi:hypothetical protein